jgi:SAM-dependent methyltransferase
MPNAAERFYERSHEQNKRISAVPTVTVTEMTERMRSPEHRYFSVMQYLEAHPGLDAVELGFGSLVLAAALAQFCRSYRIVDIADRREGMELPANMEFSKSNLDEDFNLPAESFDAVVAMMVIEHLYDPFHSFEQVFRLVRPGGRIFINLPNIGSIHCRWQLLQGKLPVTSSPDWFEKREWDGNHLHYFTLQETLRLAEFTGMRLEGIFPVGRHTALKRMRPSLLCHEISYVFSKPE